MRWVRREGHDRLLVTILMGESFTAEWVQHCLPGWERYAERYGYDLLVFDTALDSSARATARSPSWQKCLVFEHPDVQAYTRAVWVDADVLINPVTAPDIAASVPQDKVGGTNAYSVYTPAMHDHLYQAYIDLCAVRGRPLFICRRGRDYYRLFGIDTDLDDVLQCGVLVVSPRHHAAVFREVYDRYEAKVDPATGYTYNLEMRPLSHALVSRGLHHFLDFRFNAIATNLVYLNAPYLFHRPADYPETHWSLVVSSIFSHHWFLHFAGGPEIRSWMRFVQPDVFTPLDL